MQVISETHIGNDRAGFSVTVLSSDRQGIELAFWTNKIWVQEGGSEPDLFTQAEGAAFDTTAALHPYELTIGVDTYSLSISQTLILSGTVRDYTEFTHPLLDVYETPNFIFLGDNTMQAGANIKLTAVTVITKATPPDRTVTNNTPLIIDDLGMIDLDANGNDVVVTMTVDSGVLTLTTIADNGLSASDISGNGTGSLVMTGSVGEINASLAFSPALIYRSNIGFVGNDTLNITINDQGNTGSGGALTGQVAFDISVAGANLGITKSVTPNTNVTYRGEVTYTVVITNDGTMDASSVLVTDTLSTATAFDHWINKPGGTVQAGNAITWTGTVTANQAVTLTFVASHTGSYGDIITNTAYYSLTGGRSSAGDTFSVQTDSSGSSVCFSTYHPQEQ